MDALVQSGIEDACKQLSKRSIKNFIGYFKAWKLAYEGDDTVTQLIKQHRPSRIDNYLLTQCIFNAIHEALNHDMIIELLEKKYAEK